MCKLSLVQPNFDLVQKSPDGFRSKVRGVKWNEPNFGKPFSFIDPLEAPQFRFKDIVKSDFQALQETFFQASPFHSLDAVADLAEGTLNGVGIEGKGGDPKRADHWPADNATPKSQPSPDTIELDLQDARGTRKFQTLGQ